MKKMLALTLALLLALSLCAPALAAEASAPAENETAEKYAAYEAAHPEELAALDAETLLAGWGYEDFILTAEEQFLEYRDEATLDEAVKRQYLKNRLLVEDISADAEEYRAEYPEEWAAFDPDLFYTAQAQQYNTDKADYMAYWNILTDEEFADMMFALYINGLEDEEDEYDPEAALADDGDDGWDFEDWTDEWADDLADDQGEPTLTLVVNGVATEIALEAEDWVTYLSVDDARTLLGGAAAAPTAQGRVPLRQAAEAAGWDVVWYDGGLAGRDQQVCLWNEKVFRSELEEEFGPLQAFCQTWRDAVQAELQRETPRKSTQTTTAEVTTFSTLDGSRSYTFRARGEQVWQSGVIDQAVTLNLSGLAGLFTDQELESLTGEPDAAARKSLLSAVAIETITDVNEGGVAFRAPALAFFDADLSGWQTSYDPDWDASAQWDVVGTLYEEMLDEADGQGGVAARQAMEQKSGVLAALFGAERFHQSGEGRWTYTLTTDQANAALGQLLAEDGAQPDETGRVFQTCELTCHVDKSGGVDVTLTLRPDTAGIAQLAVDAVGGEPGQETALGSVLLRGLLGSLDLELKLGASRSSEGSQGSLTLHLNNRGILKLTTESTAGSAGAAPRQLADVERQSVYDPLGLN